MAHTYGADEYMNAPELVPALPITYRPGTGTYLIVAPQSAQRPEVVAFTRWIHAEVKQFNAQLNAWFAAAQPNQQKLRRK
jgi:DNA-binding transcriptional LysR family regulator